MNPCRMGSLVLQELREPYEITQHELALGAGIQYPWLGPGFGIYKCDISSHFYVTNSGHFSKYMVGGFWD